MTGLDFSKYGTPISLPDPFFLRSRCALYRFRNTSFAHKFVVMIIIFIYIFVKLTHDSMTKSLVTKIQHGQTFIVLIDNIYWSIEVK